MAPHKRMLVTVLVVALILVMFAALLMLAGIAGVAGRLPRNRFVGVRSPETLVDDDSFALANRVAGPTMIAASVIVLSGAAAAALLRKKLRLVIRFAPIRNIPQKRCRCGSSNVFEPSTAVVDDFEHHGSLIGSGCKRRQ